MFASHLLRCKHDLHTHIYTLYAPLRKPRAKQPQHCSDLIILSRGTCQSTSRQHRALIKRKSSYFWQRQHVMQPFRQCGYASRQRVSDISCFRRSGFATTSHIDNMLIINNFALLLLLLRLDIVSSRFLLSMQATSIDHFEESHIFQGIKQDPRKKEAIMQMSQFLRAKSFLVARAFLPYMYVGFPGKNLYAPISSPSEVYQ